MFDMVRFSAPCWKCGAMLRSFQTKDSPPPHLMEFVNIDQIRDGGNMVDVCDDCDSWNYYEVRDGVPRFDALTSGWEPKTYPED